MGNAGHPPRAGSSESNGAFQASSRSSSGIPAIAPPGFPASGPKTVDSKHEIQHRDEVFLLAPVEPGPQLGWKQLLRPAASTAVFMASSAQALATRLITAATFHSRPYPADTVEYHVPPNLTAEASRQHA